MARILIVEDEEMIRELMHITVSQGGHHVTTASNGEIALELLKRTRFDLVLLDIQMPRMGGLDVLRTMSRMGRAMPPVLMVTANRSLEAINEAMQLGCAGYVAKPFQPAELRARVAKALMPRAVPKPIVLEI